MVPLSSLNLVLFFTRGISLETWHRIGSLEREVALYRALRPHLASITFVTYGDAADLDHNTPQLEGIRILCNRRRLPLRWYVRYLKYFPGLFPKKGLVFKSNQMQGAEIAGEVARCHNGAFIARFGYPFSYYRAQQYGTHSPEAENALALEEHVLRQADRVVVTTAAMQKQVMARHGLSEKTVRVIPNYVTTDLFSPGEGSVARSNPEKTRLLYIGRLNPEKNLLQLLAAVAGLPLELWLVGDGPLRRSLEKEATRLGVSARFFGNQPHESLPGLLNSATLFILPSLYEGHPKTLLEAMACGRPVIGTNVPGIREVICHGVNGLLCENGAAGIRQSIEALMNNPSQQKILGAAARQFALQHFALEEIVRRELALLAALATPKIGHARPNSGRNR